MTVYENRDCMHKYMAPPESCDRCHGRGWYIQEVEGTENDYIPDTREVFCDCPGGVERRRVEDAPVRHSEDK